MANPSIQEHMNQLKTLKFEAGKDEFWRAYEKHFNHALGGVGWVHIGYAGKQELKFLGDGNDLAVLRERLEEADFNYVLLRIPVDDPKAGTSSKKTRDIFVQWIGPKTSILGRGTKKTHIGEVTKLLQPFHAELTAVRRENFVMETILSKSDPLSGSHEI